MPKTKKRAPTYSMTVTEAAKFLFEVYCGPDGICRIPLSNSVGLQGQ
jgi:hypothetical protein